jgi:ubiquinone/menaquinone biosynthesis C-methylase UbiE
MKLNAGITERESWDKEWRNLFDHYQQDLRHAYYISAILNDKERNILELGAGSFRDVGALNSWGISCKGVDYSTESVLRAKEYFSDIKDKIYSGDCFDLDFDDNTFDLSYHNGLWGYFSDKDIVKLAKEQARVSKYRIVATVHNAHNKSFVGYFDELKAKDPLYDIRFFEVEEITGLMHNVAKNVTIIPVGKGKKYYEDELIYSGLGMPKDLKKLFEFHQLDLLECSERIMCIGTI